MRFASRNSSFVAVLTVFHISSTPDRCRPQFCGSGSSIAHNQKTPVTQIVSCRQDDPLDAFTGALLDLDAIKLESKRARELLFLVAVRGVLRFVKLTPR